MNFDWDGPSSGSLSVAGSLPMMPDEKIMLPTRAPMGMGAAPWDTPSTSMERGRRAVDVMVRILESKNLERVSVERIRHFKCKTASVSP
jgi:hypothetical protein